MSASGAARKHVETADFRQNTLIKFEEQDNLNMRVKS